MLEDCWVYLAIVGSLFLTGVGLPPLPEEVPIIAAGIAASRQEIIWWLAWPACVAGITLADLTLYGVGRFWGAAIFRWRWVKRILPEERRGELEARYRRHGVKLLLTGRLIPGFRTGVFLTAGTVRYPFVRFLVVDGVSAVLSAGLAFFGSYFLAESFAILSDDLNRVRFGVGVAAVAALAGYWVLRFRRSETRGPP